MEEGVQEVAGPLPFLERGQERRFGKQVRRDWVGGGILLASSPQKEVAGDEGAVRSSELQSCLWSRTSKQEVSWPGLPGKERAIQEALSVCCFDQKN